MSELKPCPFCGGEARITTGRKGYFRFYFVYCNNCWARSQKDTKEEVIAAWNKRVPEGK